MQGPRAVGRVGPGSAGHRLRAPHFPSRPGSCSPTPNLLLVPTKERDLEQQSKKIEKFACPDYVNDTLGAGFPPAEEDEPWSWHLPQPRSASSWGLCAGLLCQGGLGSPPGTGDPAPGRKAASSAVTGSAGGDIRLYKQRAESSETVLRPGIINPSTFENCLLQP